MGESGFGAGIERGLFRETKNPTRVRVGLGGGLQRHPAAGAHCFSAFSIVAKPTRASVRILPSSY
jgi:hypothetical protein